ncbi:MFS transporter [Pseudonocardia xishanensis]|uniref:MFS transporter n=1 Tax=Pseudonocardia xishanensis TaxID=630995 RepID=A0ABP8RIP8_9PSEU
MPLSAGVRRGDALGNVAAGTFGTVPGLLLLPYLTDAPGVAAGLAGLLVVLPKAWDVVLNPVAGRVSDRAGTRRPFLLWAGIPGRPRRTRSAPARHPLPHPRRGCWPHPEQPVGPVVRGPRAAGVFCAGEAAPRAARSSPGRVP